MDRRISFGLTIDPRHQFAHFQSPNKPKFGGAQIRLRTSRLQLFASRRAFFCADVQSIANSYRLHKFSKVNRAPIIDALLANGILLAHDTFRSRVWFSSRYSEWILAGFAKGASGPCFFPRLQFTPCLIALAIAIVVIAFVSELLLLWWRSN